MAYYCAYLHLKFVNGCKKMNEISLNEKCYARYGNALTLWDLGPWLFVFQLKVLFTMAYLWKFSSYLVEDLFAHIFS